MCSISEALTLISARAQAQSDPLASGTSPFALMLLQRRLDPQAKVIYLLATIMK